MANALIAAGVGVALIGLLVIGVLLARARIIRNRRTRVVTAAEAQYRQAFIDEFEKPVATNY